MREVKGLDLSTRSMMFALDLVTWTKVGVHRSASQGCAFPRFAGFSGIIIHNQLFHLIIA
jgi:hypothetical protein